MTQVNTGNMRATFIQTTNTYTDYFLANADAHAANANAINNQETINAMQRDRHIAVWLRMLAEKEISTARNAKKLLASQGKKIAASYREGGAAEAENTAKKGQEQWARVLVATYSKVVRDFADYLDDQLGLKKQKARFDDIVQAYIARQAFKKSLFITQTNVKAVRAAVSEGVEAGEGEREISKRINESIGGSAVSDSRSRTIARTEVHNAASFGMQTAAEESERNLIREWVSVHDQRTREAHAEADGQQRGMDEPFEVDGESIDMPGDGSPENAINCRCTVIYIPQTRDYEGDSDEELI